MAILYVLVENEKTVICAFGSFDQSVNGHLGISHLPEPYLRTEDSV